MSGKKCEEGTVGERGEGRGLWGKGMRRGDCEKRDEGGDCGEGTVARKLMAEYCVERDDGKGLWAKG